VERNNESVRRKGWALSSSILRLWNIFACLYRWGGTMTSGIGRLPLERYGMSTAGLLAAGHDHQGVAKASRLSIGI
jgi:hypothetical protein